MRDLLDAMRELTDRHRDGIAAAPGSPDVGKRPPGDRGPFMHLCARGDLNPHALSDTGT